MTTQASAPHAPPYADLPTQPDEIFDRILDWRKRGDDLVRLSHQLRAVAPVWQAPIERLGRPWVITRHADAGRLVRNSALVKDERLLGLSGMGQGGPYMQVLSRMFAFMPPPRHTRLRGLANRVFTPRSVEKLRPDVQALVDQLIDDAEPRGEMDLVRDYAFRVPVTVICRMLGAPVEDVPRIEAWAGTFSRRADEGELLSDEMEVAGDEAARNFVDYVKELMADRRAAPRDDLLSRFLEVQKEADDLSDDDLAATTILLFQAGHETTANMIAKGALALLTHPDEFEKLRTRPELAENATEELLRFDTPVQLTHKFAAEDIPFHDRMIKQGDAVTLFWGAINRDPERYGEPDRLDLSREEIDHYSFGMGSHFCLGASLARLEIAHAMSTLVRRLPNMKLDTDVLEYKTQLHIHGLARLPVVW